MLRSVSYRLLRAEPSASFRHALDAFSGGGVSSPTRAMSAEAPPSPKKAKTMSGGIDVSPPSLSSSLSAISPTLALVPPGNCQFTPDFKSVPLMERHAVSSTSSLLRFRCPDEDKSLGLSTCACVLARAELPTVGEGDEGKGTEEVIRPYTPISTNAQLGSFDLLVKHYPNGRMSKHLSALPVGSTLDFKHINFNVKLQAPFKQKHIGMLVGGTGITPMIQALHAILGNPDSESKVSVLYGSKVESDILGRELLDRWSAKSGDGSRLDVTIVLSDEPSNSKWTGERGYINRQLVENNMPAPSFGDDVILFVCGPPPMYDALCGPRDEKEVKGLLGEMGYGEGQVYKF